MTSARATKLTFAFLATAILMAVVTTLLLATPNGVLAEAPGRPTGLTATAVDHDTIDLTWNHPDPATVDHYRVLSRRVGAGAGRLTQVGTSTTTSFQHDGLEPESTYVYRVKPVNSAGEEVQRSPPDEITTPAEETPALEPDPPPAQPQRSEERDTSQNSATAYVSNIGQDRNIAGFSVNSNISQAQGFTPGPRSGGYPLSAVGLQFDGDDSDGIGLVVAIFPSAT